MESLPKILLEKYRSQLGIFLVLAILVGGGVLALIQSRPKTSKIEEIEVEATTSSTPIPAAPKIKIDIAGAVTNPGVYELPEISRVEDALDAAGGLAEGADRDWVSKNLNLATKLKDGDKLYIPQVGETSSAPSTTSGASVPPSAGTVSGAGNSTGGESLNCDKVNINTASAATLAECLEGIAEKRAAAIIAGRPYSSIEELVGRKIIWQSIFEKIKDQLTVN